MEYRIEKIDAITLIGQQCTMSLIENKTQRLWQNFMPNKKEITHRVGAEHYSVEVYENLDYFKQFNPANSFQKWAAVQVSSAENIPSGMEILIIPAGAYAVFNYKGKPSEAPKLFQQIFSQWLPASAYQLENRPHFSVMGEKYLGEHPDSEETFWIPVRKR